MLKRKNRSILAITLAMIMLFSSSIWVSASSDDGVAVVYEEEEYLGNINEMNVITADVSLLSTSISFGGSIEAKTHAEYTASRFYITYGSTFDYEVVWTPSSRYIKVCRINADTGEVYGTAAKTGGTASGTVKSVAPSGDYYFSVYNSSTSTITSFTCNISF